MRTFVNSEIVSISEIGETNGLPMAILVDQDGNEVGYLTPFRGYRFQVSETKDGQGDLGSSPVLAGKLSDIAKYEERDTAVSLLYGQAVIAIMEFCSRTETRFSNGKWEEWTDSTGWNQLSYKLDRFVDRSIEWLKTVTAYDKK